MEKKKKLIMLGVILLLIIVSGATFAILTWNSTMIKLGINTNCFTIDYTKGGDITGSLKLINEEDLISNGKFTIKEGVGVSAVNIGINSNCSIEGYGKILLNITSISNVFTTGDSKGALKYAVLKNTSTITNPTNINTTSLLNQSFDIIENDTITSSDTITLLIKQLSNTEIYKYIIVIYIDNNLAGNDITSATFSGNISSEASQVFETPEYCFYSEYNNNDMTAGIISYNCNENNDLGYDPITNVVVIPNYVYAREFTLKENPTDEAKDNCSLCLPSIAEKVNLSITSAQAKTLCGGGTINGITFASLYNQYKEQVDGTFFSYTGMFNININTKKKYKVTYITGGYWYDVIFLHSIDAKNIILPNSLTTIGEHTFSGSQLTSIVLPDSVTTIGDRAFFSSQLTSISLPDSLITIGDGAFSGSQLTNITIPESVTTIVSGAFQGNQLTSITIPESVTTIGDSAFANNNLNYVYIGNNSKLTDIGSGAFLSSNASNPNLKKIYYNGSNQLPWINAVNGSDSSTKFVTGTVPSYTSGTTTYNEVLITTGQ